MKVVFEDKEITGSLELASVSPHMVVEYDLKTKTLTISKLQVNVYEDAVERLLSEYSGGTTSDGTTSDGTTSDSTTESNHRYITSINNVTPVADGVLFLTGSECDSVRPLPDESKLEIVDLCPACAKCDNQYKIKRQIEFYTLYYEILKDVNLYEIGDVRTRYADLRQHLMSEQSGCAEWVDMKEYEDLLNSVGYLLQEYITTVHMWNYAVSTNNNDTRISNPPEDTCGILVQSKRALTDCSGDRGLRCTVALSPADDNEDTVQEDLSIFVPVSPASQVGMFTPFTSTMVPAIELNTGEHFTDKTLTALFNPITIAGTCIVTVKFLPFIYTVMTYATDEPHVTLPPDPGAPEIIDVGPLPQGAGDGTETSGGETDGEGTGEPQITLPTEDPEPESNVIEQPQQQGSGSDGVTSGGTTVSVFTSSGSTIVSGGIADIMAHYNALQQEGAASDAGLFNITSGGSTTSSRVLPTGVGMDIVQQANPTAEDYNRCKSYPSQSANGFNRWKIVVTWDVMYGLVVEQTNTETFYFSTPRCRVPLDGVVSDSDFVDIQLQTEEETTE